MARLLSILLILAVLPDGAFAQPGSPDPTFGVNGTVRFGFGGGDDAAAALALLSGGTYLVMGYAEDGSIERPLVARHLSNGSLDPTFGVKGVAVLPTAEAGQALGVVLQSSGRLVVAGGGNSGTPFAAGLLSDGSLDPSFGVNGFAEIPGSVDFYPCAVEQQGNKVLIAGRLLVPGTDSFAVIRLTADGAMDPTFDGDGLVSTSVLDLDLVEGMTLQPDGKIVLVGTVRNATGFTAVGMVRYDANGVLDTTFDGDGKVITFAGTGNSTGHAITTQSVSGSPDMLLVAGSADKAGAGTDGLLLRYNLNGTLEPVFGSGGVVIQTIGLGDDAFFTVRFVAGTTHANPSHIYVGGQSRINNSNATYDAVVASFTISGNPDTGFGGGDGIVVTAMTTGNDAIRSLFLSGTRIVVAGSASTLTNNTNRMLARYLAGGALDTAFDGDGIRIDDNGEAAAGALGMARQPDGKLVLAGYGQDGRDAALARLLPDGTPDSTFSADGRVILDFGGSSEYLYDVALQSDQKIVVTGTVGFSSSYVLAVARFLPDGSLDTGFGVGGKLTSQFKVFDEGTAIAVQPDGRILVAGTTSNFTSGAIRVSRFLANGAADATFGQNGHLELTAGGTTAGANDMALQPDGRIVITGERILASGEDEIVTLRLTTTGLLDPTFGTGGLVAADIGPAADTGTDVIVQPDGRILVTAFTRVTSVNMDPCVLRYDREGRPDPTFGNGGFIVMPVAPLDERGQAIGIQPDGRVIMAGGSGVYSDDRQMVFRLEASGTPDASFAVGGRCDVAFGAGTDAAYAIDAALPGKILVAGLGGSLMTATRLDAGPAQTAVPEPNEGSMVGWRVGPPSPNPTPRGTSIAFELTAPARMSADLVDVTGRLVRRLATSALVPAGVARLDWDGRDESGLQAAAGIYFVRITDGERVVSRRVVVTR